MALSVHTREAPIGWFDNPLIRSWLEEDNRGSLWRVEIREHPQSGMRATARFPVPQKKVVDTRYE